nr:hypothetical protein [Tanacetum cinerariifolium]
LLLHPAGAEVGGRELVGGGKQALRQAGSGGLGGRARDDGPAGAGQEGNGRVLHRYAVGAEGERVRADLGQHGAAVHHVL